MIPKNRFSEKIVLNQKASMMLFVAGAPFSIAVGMR
jgi:hypothetical protein